MEPEDVTLGISYQCHCPKWYRLALPLAVCVNVAKSMKVQSYRQTSVQDVPGLFTTLRGGRVAGGEADKALIQQSCVPDIPLALL